jgi:quercetin dioxygenase-like cupin family protein
MKSVPLRHRLAAAACAAALSAQTLPPGFSAVPLLDNATLQATRLRLEPGAREPVQVHAFPSLAVHLSHGRVELVSGDPPEAVAREPGQVDFFPAGTSHTVANTGEAPLMLLAVSLKPDRRRAASFPAAQPPPPGVTRTPLLDNADVAIARVELAAGASEPVHTHPYDLLVVPVTDAEFEITIGNRRAARLRTAGEAFFVARDTPHALANLERQTVAVVAIAVK